MLSYRSWLNTSKNQNEKWESRTKTSTVISHFENTDISPIYCKKDFPYIPSFSDLFNGTYDEKILNFAKRKSKDKNVIYWK